MPTATANVDNSFVELVPASTGVIQVWGISLTLRRNVGEESATAALRDYLDPDNDDPLFVVASAVAPPLAASVLGGREPIASVTIGRSLRFSVTSGVGSVTVQYVIK